jgi:hypothetical protein
MIFRCTKPGFLILALICAACGVNDRQAQPSPTSEHPSGPQGGIATSTPTSNPSPVSPTPSVIPTSAPRNFTEEFSANAPDWTFLQIDNGQLIPGPSTRDGFLVFDLGAANQWVYALYEPQDYSDVVIEAQIQSRTPGDGAAGIVCRYDESRGWYELNIFADQTYELLFGQWLAAGVARYTPLYHGESEKIEADTNVIGLSCEGNVLTPVINGAPMRKWTEQKFALQKGKVGLSASSFQDAPFTIAFDRVKVSEP